jgi:hypothetical protein
MEMSDDSPVSVEAGIELYKRIGLSSTHLGSSRASEFLSNHPCAGAGFKVVPDSTASKLPPQKEE